MAAAGLLGGLLFGIVGTGLQVFGAAKQQEAQKKALAAQQRAETIREQAMESDAMRRRREAVRQGIIQRAVAQSSATNQGAESGSALGGAYGQVAGNTATAIGGIEASRTAGAALFQTNREVLNYRKDEADAGFISSLGQGFSSLGGAFGKSQGSLGRLFG